MCAFFLGGGGVEKNSGEEMERFPHVPHFFFNFFFLLFYHNIIKKEKKQDENPGFSDPPKPAHKHTDHSF